MGERKGTNKYYPPDFDPKKHKSLAGYTGAHPLRERARKLHQGILIIRFEMPYNIWCDGCNNHIGMGVRYNAEKSKIGNYYTTPIWKFRMKCHLCDNHFEIKTDPAAHDYVIILGARRKEQRWDPKENEQIVTEERSTKKKLALDAMYKLEHGADDKDKLKKAIPGIAQIEDMQATKKDDYLLNKLAREKFRGEKKSLRAAEEKDAALLEKSSLDISLLEENEEDTRMAELLKYSIVQSFDEKQKKIRDEIETRPLFPSAVDSGSKSPGVTSTSHSLVEDTRRRLGISNVRQLKSNPFSSPPGSQSSLTVASLGIVRKSRSPANVASPAQPDSEWCLSGNPPHITSISPVASRSEDRSTPAHTATTDISMDVQPCPEAMDEERTSDRLRHEISESENAHSHDSSDKEDLCIQNVNQKNERTVPTTPSLEKLRKNITNTQIREQSSSALSSLFSNYDSSGNSDSD